MRVSRDSKFGTLQKMYWNRVVLDEAHNIRTKKSSRWKSANDLDAKFRWAGE